MQSQQQQQQQWNSSAADDVDTRETATAAPFDIAVAKAMHKAQLKVRYMCFASSLVQPATAIEDVCDAFSIALYHV